MYLIVGLICNTLVLLVVLRHEMRGTSVTVYLTTLAITDNVFLLNTILYSCSNALSSGSYAIHLPFPFQVAVSYWTGHMNSWIVIALTIDRLLLVYRPLKAAFFCSQKMALKVSRSCMHILTNIDIVHYTNSNNNRPLSILKVLEKCAKNLIGHSRLAFNNHESNIDC